jgi:hypothetical protein
MTLPFGCSFALRHGLFVDTRLFARGGRGSTFFLDCTVSEES